MSPPDSPALRPVPPDAHLFGFRLREILQRSALGPAGEEGYLKDYRRRHVRFLVSLMNRRDERFTYDLRILSRPDADHPTRGAVELALLCRSEGLDAEAARAYALDLQALLHASFVEHVFAPLDETGLDRFLSPFPIGGLASVTRRAGWERFDTLTHRNGQTQSIGFHREARPAGDETGEPPESLYHLFPLLPTSASVAPLHRLLLHHPEPVLVSCRLRSTSLGSGEESFLEEQIGRCERAAQTSLQGFSGELRGLRPTLREQARAYQRYQTRLLRGLDDDAAVVTLDVASTERLPAPVLDTVGGLVSRPAGSPNRDRSDGSSRSSFLAGGYELSQRPAEGEAASAFSDLTMVPAEFSEAPAAAERLPHLFDAREGFALFRLPPAPEERLPGTTVRKWRTVPPPRELPAEGTLLGKTYHRGAEQPVRLTAEDRKRHVYLVGQTGTGKTTMLETMALEDMRAGRGLCVVDPHGDLFSDLLGKVPRDREDDVVLIDPTDHDHPVGINPLEHEDERQRHFLVQEIVGMVRRLLRDEYGGSASEFAGPIFWQQMRRNLLLAMSDPDDPGTLLEFYNIFQEPDYWKRWLPLKIDDPLLERWVEEVLPERDYLQPGGEGISLGGYVGSKFEGFVFDPLLRNIFCQKRSTMSLSNAMDEGKIVLVNLAKGELTEDNARFLGMVLLAKLMTAAMDRVRVPEEERRDFHLYVDEFQSLATENFVTLLSEARKFGLSLTLANQFVRQIQNERIVNAIFGNVGTIVCFRVGEEDAETMERAFLPAFGRRDLADLPNWRACASPLVRGQTVAPFTISTVVDDRPWSEETAKRVRRKSRRKYTRNREEVEREAAAVL